MFKKMKWVYTCPKNQKDVDESSKRLNCTNDLYGKNTYMCLPNVEKTSLIEFCYDGIMGIHEKGHCLEINATDGALVSTSCIDFMNGCPDTVFWSHQIFNHSACQSINMKDHCYTSHPVCPPSTIFSNKDVRTYNTTSMPFFALFAVFSAVILMCFLWIIKYKEHEEKKQGLKKTVSGTEGFGTDELNSLTSSKDKEPRHEQSKSLSFLGEGVDEAYSETSDTQTMSSEGYPFCEDAVNKEFTSLPLLDENFVEPYSEGKKQGLKKTGSFNEGFGTEEKKKGHKRSSSEAGVVTTRKVVHITREFADGSTKKVTEETKIKTLPNGDVVEIKHKRTLSNSTTPPKL